MRLRTAATADDEVWGGVGGAGNEPVDRRHGGRPNGRRKVGAVALIAVALASHRAAGADEARGIDTSHCKDVVSRIIAATGASFDHATPNGDEIVLRHPYAQTFALQCARGSRMSAYVGWHGPFPPSLYFTLVAAAGAIVTREGGPTLKAAAQRCQLAALKSKDETDELDLPHAELDCQAFLHDGGGTSITVAPGHDDPAEP